MRWIVPVSAILLAGCAADPLDDAENSYFALKREGVTGERLCDAARRIRDEQRRVGMNYGFVAEASDERIEKDCAPK